MQILRPDGLRVADIRPRVRHGAGSRVSYAAFLDPAHWQASVDEALRQALVNLGSRRNEISSVAA